jgi:hypothetical protein
MGNKGELIDVNRRIEFFEKFVGEFVQVFGQDIENPDKLENLAKEMEALREKFDGDLQNHDYASLEEDVKKMDRVDKAMDKLMIQDLKEESKKIHDELHDIVRKAENH